MGKRTIVVTGSASGIGAATARMLRARGERVIGVDLREAEVIADLATPAGRKALVDGVTKLSGGTIDAIVANAGGGPPETSLSLNFFGTVATLEGLRPLLAGSSAPRAVAVSSIASLRPARGRLIELCLAMNEAGAKDATADVLREGGRGGDPMPAAVQAGLDLYGNAKQALQRWCRAAAPKPEWAGAGILLNVVALGFYDTPAAAYALNDLPSRAALESMFPLRGSFPGRPEEAAALLAWLVSTENTQVTGQILFADGGFEAKAGTEAART